MAEKRTTPARARNTPKSQMKGKSSSGKKTTTRKSNTQQTADNTFSRQVLMVVLFTLGVLFIFVSFIKGSGYWETLHASLYGFFGLPAVLWFVAMIVVTVLIAQEKPVKDIILKTIWMFVLLLLVSSGLTAFTVKGADSYDVDALVEVCRNSGKEYKGGGVIGGLTGGIAAKYIGKAGAIIIWLLSVFAFVMISTKTSIAQLIAVFAGFFDKAKSGINNQREKAAQERARREEAVEEPEEIDEPEIPVRRKTDGKRHYRIIEEKNKKGANMLTDDEDEYIHAEPKKKKSGKNCGSSDDCSGGFDDELNRKFRLLVDAYNDDGEEETEEQPDTKKANVQSLGSSPDILVIKPKGKAKEEKKETAKPARPEPAQPVKTEPEEASKPEDSSLDDIIRKVGAPEHAKQETRKVTKADEIAEQAESVAAEIADNDKAKSAEREAYVFPPIDLLKEARNENIDMTAELRENAMRLIATLEEYGVKASVSDISRGPTVTRFEIVPAPGVKISKITTLANDIKLRLAAKSVRIEAPIPGKAAVGIEIPNAKRNTVSIRELIDSDTFRNAKGSLACVLGKDIEGNIITCDLAKMPHLLIAGSTGSGKSVCVNSMLISLMYKYTPDELRLVLVDPKKVEFEIYNGIPHLLVPVVSNPKKAAGVLQWAVVEMEKRYEMLQGKNVRSLNSYNELAEKTGEFEKMSKIVIVIDEMADLMQTTPKEVEDSIARLAAMARAAGMHIILATQRPSVDVITGTIKNNIPSRIALTVSSRIDSQTILGAGGAETLIGYGDMLYNPMGASTPKRVQGCFVSDEEVGDVISFLKRNGDAEYDESITEEIERKAAENDKGKGDSSSNEGGGFHDEDPTMSKAIEAVIQAGQASVSLLQRKLGVGYARAGKLIDQLEERGIVGPYEGSKPRKVLMTKTQWIEMNMSSSEPIAIDTSFDTGTLPFDIDDTED